MRHILLRRMKLAPSYPMDCKGWQCLSTTTRLGRLQLNQAQARELDIPQCDWRCPPGVQNTKGNVKPIELPHLARSSESAVALDVTESDHV